MNKLLFYIFSLLLIVSCASDNIEDSIMTDNNLPATGQGNNKEEEILWPQDVMTATMKGVDAEGSNEMTRSSLYYYHEETPAGMAFRWTQGEKVGVFETRNSENQQVTITSEIESSGKTSTARFYINDASVNYWFNGLYYAYRPYNAAVGEGTISNSAIPVDYTGQTQTANVKMSLWTNADKTDYVASEKAASAHLGDKDYLVSSATSFAGGGIHFDMKRLGGIVRFYLVAPKNGANTEEIKYKELQLVNKDHYFTLETTMSLPAQALADTPKTKSHMISLALSDETNHSFDFTNSDTRHDYYYSKYGNMIVAYMIMAPVNLTTKSTLYLIGEDSHGENRYFSKEISAKDIHADFLHQWSLSNIAPDEPITFNAISVEEWKEGTTFSNGDDGKGTEGW